MSEIKKKSTTEYKYLPRQELDAVGMIIVRDYAGYHLTEETRERLHAAAISCETWPDLLALQKQLPKLIEKSVITEADAAAISAAVKYYDPIKPNDEKIYSAFKNKELAVTRLCEMAQIHINHTAEETGRESPRVAMTAITNAAGRAVKQLKLRPAVTLQVLKSINDVYSFLLLACFSSHMWDGKATGAQRVEFIKQYGDLGGFPDNVELEQTAEYLKLVSLPAGALDTVLEDYPNTVLDVVKTFITQKSELAEMGERWPKLESPPDSYADELSKITKVASIVPHSYISPNDTISNHLNSQTVKGLKINGGPVNLPDRYRQNAATKTIIIPASLESDFEFNHEITEYDRAVSNAVYSLIEAGNSVFTAAMIYRTMTGKTDGGKIPPAQQKLIDESMEKLAAIRVTADLLEAAKKRKVTIDGEPAESLEHLTIKNYLLPTKSITAKINSKTTIAYSLLDTPPLYKWAKTTRQITTLPIEVMDVKKLKGGKVGYQSESATETRTAIKSYLLRRLQAIHNRAETQKEVQTKARTKDPAKEVTAHSETIRYKSVMQAAGMDWGSMPRQSKDTYRKFIKTCLTNWQQDETIILSGFKFSDAKQKTTIVGVRVTYPIK